MAQCAEVITGAIEKAGLKTNPKGPKRLKHFLRRCFGPLGKPAQTQNPFAFDSVVGVVGYGLREITRSFAVLSDLSPRNHQKSSSQALEEIWTVGKNHQENGR